MILFMISFGSDNHAGIHPEVLEKIAEANQGYALAYGGDEWTKRAELALKKQFGSQANPWIVFNGTGANVLSIASALQSYQAVLCAETAHIAEDEVGAPEFISGSKLISIPSVDNKLTPELLEPRLSWIGISHRVQPKMISITQTTEFGTLYSLDELQELVRFAKKHDLLLHMDGARISNAAAALRVDLAKMVEGFDCVSVGGTKNGLMGAEAVLFFNDRLAEGVIYRRKQVMQLASKMRFLSAQMVALFEGDLWLRNARHANQMAAYFYEQLQKSPHVTVNQKVQANAIFGVMNKDKIEKMQKVACFYVWRELPDAPYTAEIRLMTSFQTSKVEIDSFLNHLHQ